MTIFDVSLSFFFWMYLRILITLLRQFAILLLYFLMRGGSVVNEVQFMMAASTL